MMLEKIDKRSFFDFYLRGEYYFTQNCVGETLYRSVDNLGRNLIREKGLDIFLDTDEIEFARTSCLPVSFTVGVNYLLDKLFFSSLPSSNRFSIGDLFEIAVISHNPQDCRTLDPRTGNWYYSFFKDVASRIGLYGRVFSGFDSTMVFTEFLKDKAICLVSLDNQVVSEVTFKNLGINKKLRGGRHIFLLHSWNETSRTFLYSDVFNPIPESISTINLSVSPEALDQFLVTQKMPKFSTRALVLARKSLETLRCEINNPILSLHPELSFPDFLAWLRTHAGQTEKPR